MAICISDGCIKAYKSHRLGRIKALEAGWFIERRKGGRAYCPDHVPGHIKAWRIRRHREHVPKSSPFECRTCGSSGENPCVVGKTNSVVWLRQIPLHRWHSKRLADYKKLRAEQRN